MSAFEHGTVSLREALHYFPAPIQDIIIEYKQSIEHQENWNTQYAQDNYWILVQQFKSFCRLFQEALESERCVRLSEIKMFDSNYPFLF